MQNSEFIKNFVEEAMGHVEALETGLLAMENGSGDENMIHSIFRYIHSVKGAASFFDLNNIVNLSHSMESLLGEIRNGGVIIDNRIIDTLLSSNDTLKQMLLNIEDSENIDISNHLAKLSSVLGSPPLEKNITPTKPDDHNKELDIFPANGGRSFYKITTPGNEQQAMIDKIKTIGRIIEIKNSGDIENQPENQTIEVTFNTVLELDLVSMALDLPEENIIELDSGMINKPDSTIADESFNLTDAQPTKVNIIPAEYNSLSQEIFSRVNEEKMETAGQCSVFTEDSIRVHISLLNDLLNLAGEMVLGRNQLLRNLAPYRKQITGLNTVLQNIDSITTDLQEKIMQTRMQPVAKVFARFPRIIREMSKKLNKDIELKMQGSDVELDKSIIEALGDPLTHLIRNAADHGLEKPTIREKLNKSPTGNITLRAYHEGGHVNIDVIDDGKGIDIEKIKAKAINQGIISPAEINLMGERNLLDLLFKPGFSTASAVTDFSGRGVGLDVVKTNIEKLGGNMEITTELGMGTTFRLILPLTLAIISAIIVEVQGQKFVLPQVNLLGMVRIKQDEADKKIEQVQGSNVLRYRGKLLPIVYLAEVLGLTEDTPDINEVIRILIIKSGSKQFGLVVDVIHDGEEILVKNIPRYLKNCHCYSGVTILGDGKIAMILDFEGIASKANLQFNDGVNELPQNKGNLPENLTEKQNLLIFKCSGPEIYGIDLSIVSRVEKISKTQLEVIGDKEFITYRGQSLRIVRPEDYLPVRRRDNNPDLLYVIIPKWISYPIGLLIEKIEDTMEANVQFNEAGIKARGLFGTAILANKIVLFINIYELLEMAVPRENKTEEILLTEVETTKTILVVEDTPFFLNIEKKYLESAGYKVLTAQNGREGWELLQETQVDAVISDIEMPLMDGYELIKRIRNDKNIASLPVVAVTSKADEQSIRKGIEAGFNFYEVKLDKDRLLDVVKLAVEKRGGYH